MLVYAKTIITTLVLMPATSVLAWTEAETETRGHTLQTLDFSAYRGVCPQNAKISHEIYSCCPQNSVPKMRMEYLRARDIKVQVEERHVPRDVAMRGIRSHADMLRIAGYVPKWLDEFK